jgi:hypothetical protein
VSSLTGIWLIALAKLKQTLSRLSETCWLRYLLTFSLEKPVDRAVDPKRRQTLRFTS